ncbi:sod [Nucleospora cyclopteri]
MRQFKLGDLPYSYNALEPFIDEATMRMHHEKNHQGYVNSLNSVTDKLSNLNSGMLDMMLLELKTDPSKVDKDLYKVLINAGGGNYCHTFYFNSLSPPSDQTSFNMMGTKLKQEMDKKYPTLEELKRQFIENSKKLFGSGWVWLVYCKEDTKVLVEITTNTLTTRDDKKTSQSKILKGGNLEIVCTKNQESPPMFSRNLIPVLPMDLWEHAFILKHKNNKVNYINDFFSVINWTFITEVFDKTVVNEEILIITDNGEIKFQK